MPVTPAVGSPPLKFVVRFRTGRLVSVMAEWLTLLLRILEAPGLNLGPETGYRVSDFSRFSSVAPSKFRDSGLS
jgi:hypothetical protein